MSDTFHWPSLVSPPRRGARQAEGARKLNEMKKLGLAKPGHQFTSEEARELALKHGFQPGNKLYLRRKDRNG